MILFKYIIIFYYNLFKKKNLIYFSLINLLNPKIINIRSNDMYIFK